jgi:hypothetical protein
VIEQDLSVFLFASSIVLLTHARTAPILYCAFSCMPGRCFAALLLNALSCHRPIHPPTSPLHAHPHRPPLHRAIYIRTRAHPSMPSSPASTPLLMYGRMRDMPSAPLSSTRSSTPSAPASTPPLTYGHAQDIPLVPPSSTHSSAPYAPATTPPLTYGRARDMPSSPLSSMRSSTPYAPATVGTRPNRSSTTTVTPNHPTRARSTRCCSGSRRSATPMHWTSSMARLPTTCTAHPILDTLPPRLSDVECETDSLDLVSLT